MLINKVIIFLSIMLTLFQNTYGACPACGFGDVGDDSRSPYCHVVGENPDGSLYLAIAVRPPQEEDNRAYLEEERNLRDLEHDSSDDKTPVFMASDALERKREMELLIQDIERRSPFIK